jgi:hypothetical protein
MSDFLDMAKENFSKVPVWGWIAIVGGFGLVAYLSANKQGAATYTAVPNYGGDFETNKVSESEVANRIESVVAELNSKFNERFQEQASDFYTELSERDKAYQGQLAEFNAGWGERVNALTSSFTEQNGFLQNQLGEVTKSLNEAIANEQKNNQAILDEVAGSKKVTLPVGSTYSINPYNAKEERFLRQVGEITKGGGQLSAGQQSTLNQLKKEERFVRQATEILNKGGQLSSAQLETWNSLQAKGAS